jgi:hypothetical protein
MSDAVVEQHGTVPPPSVDPLPQKRVRRPVFGKTLVVLMGILAAYKAIPIYYYYFDLKVSCGQVLQDAEIESDEEIKMRLLDVIERHGIPASARDIQVRRGEGKIWIAVPYQEDIQVTILGETLTLFSFSFSPSAEKVYR